MLFAICLLIFSGRFVISVRFEVLGRKRFFFFFQSLVWSYSFSSPFLVDMLSCFEVQALVVIFNLIVLSFCYVTTDLRCRSFECMSLLRFTHLYSGYRTAELLPSSTLSFSFWPIKFPEYVSKAQKNCVFIDSACKAVYNRR